MKELKYCPSTLAEGFDTYSPVALRHLFAGRKVSHVLPYDSPSKSEQDNEKFLENRERISISGVQIKLSMVAQKGKLRLTESAEQGTHILKPIPGDLRKVSEIPANENLTMQIASQVLGIETAANGLCFFKTDEPAYITRRFDINDRGEKLRVEDFASLAGLTVLKSGANFKYDYSYEGVAELIRKFIPAWRVEMEKFFSLVLFNFLFSNGDAHLKNFSVIETKSGDFKLTPAYDLLNTRIHVDDSDFALSGGLFKGDAKEFLTYTGKASGLSFVEFGRRIGVEEQTVIEIMEKFTASLPKIDELVANSFLQPETQRTYLQHYRERRNRLKEM